MATIRLEFPFTVQGMAAGEQVMKGRTESERAVWRRSWCSTAVRQIQEARQGLSGLAAVLAAGDERARSAAEFLASAVGALADEERQLAGHAGTNPGPVTADRVRCSGCGMWLERREAARLWTDEHALCVGCDQDHALVNRVHAEAMRSIGLTAGRVH